MQNRQNRPRYTFFRRLLFPYSGEEALTFKQSLRVLLAWMIVFPLVLSLCPLGLTAVFAYSLQKMATLFLFAFFSGFFIFGGLGLLVVIVNNQSARIRQKRERQRAARFSNTSGGRHGS
jgi:hypothetical protein